MGKISASDKMSIENPLKDRTKKFIHDFQFRECLGVDFIEL